MDVLLKAAKFGQLEFCKLLLNDPAATPHVDINYSNLNGYTALHYASYGGHVAVVEYLLSNGADHMKRNCHGETAEDAARQAGKSDVVKVLSSWKAAHSNGITMADMLLEQQYLSIINQACDSGTRGSAMPTMSYSSSSSSSSLQMILECVGYGYGSGTTVGGDYSSRSDGSSYGCGGCASSDSYSKYISADTCGSDDGAGPGACGVDNGSSQFGESSIGKDSAINASLDTDTIHQDIQSVSPSHGCAQELLSSDSSPQWDLKVSAGQLADISDTGLSISLHSLNDRATGNSDCGRSSGWVIGRSSMCDICLNHLSVSKRHAEIRWIPGRGLVVVDLGSKHGTFINGKRLTPVTTPLSLPPPPSPCLTSLVSVSQDTAQTEVSTTVAENTMDVWYDVTLGDVLTFGLVEGCIVQSLPLPVTSTPAIVSKG